jgi:hypothetical protein
VHALLLRLNVWANGLKLDTRLAEGVSPSSSPKLALRARQLLNVRSRRALAEALAGAAWTASRPDRRWSRTTEIAPAARTAVGSLRALAHDLEAIDEPCVRGVALASFLVCDPVSPLYSRSSPVTVRELADRARASLRGSSSAPPGSADAAS